MSEQLWWSIEVLDGEFSAQLWRESHGPALTEAAITRAAVDWNWDQHEWGVIFEVSFRDAEAWSVFRQLPAVTAALDAVPDPVNGLLIYSGRGGSANSASPRRPRPHLGAGSAELPSEPEPVIVAHLVEVDSGESRPTLAVAAPQASPVARTLAGAGPAGIAVGEVGQRQTQLVVVR